MAKRKLRYNEMTDQGLRMLESKEYNKRMAKKFPVGEMVSQKYYPNYFGIVVSKPRVKRFRNDNIASYLDILWVVSGFYGNGEVWPISCDEIIVAKQKKVL